MRRPFLAAVAVACTGTVLLAAGQDAAAPRANATPVPSACADTGGIVRRAVAYVARFGEELGSVIATEDYTQEIAGEVLTEYTPPPITIVGGLRVRPADPMTRTTAVTRRLRSSFLFVQLADAQGWVGFRQVLEVNGVRLKPDASQTAVEAPGESALDRWRRLSQESARHNLGSISRTLNVPTFALIVLHPENQSRFSFTPAGETRAVGGAACDVAFQETGSPTIVRNGVGGDVPSSGTFRIEPVTGRVLQSELIAGSSAAGVGMKALVRYERDRKLQLWVPREMREEYAAASGERLQCVAKYSDYRRAEVTTRIRPGD